jgi:hypothetical protein
MTPFDAGIFFTTVSYNEVAPKLAQFGSWRSTTDREIKVRCRHSRRFYQLADRLLRTKTAGDTDGEVEA